MTYLNQYASFLLATHTEDFTTKNIKLLRENHMPLLQLLRNLSEEELHAYIKKLVESFLQNLTSTNALAEAVIVLQQWKANEIPLVPRDRVGIEDFVMACSLSKQVMVELLPRFTSDLAVNNAIILELEDFFRFLLKETLPIYSEVQEQILADKTKVLQESEQNQVAINQRLTEQMARLKKTKKP